MPNIECYYIWIIKKIVKNLVIEYLYVFELIFNTNVL